jgi:hypothetical protein
MDNELLLDNGGAGGDDGAAADNDNGPQDDAALGEDDQGDSGDGQGGGEGDQGDEQGDRGQRTAAQGTPAQRAAQFKADYAKLKEIDPALAQRFQRSFYKVANVDKLGTTQELSAMKEAIELHGGAEKIAEMATDLEQYEELSRGFEVGDPKIIDGWAADYPDGFKNLLLPAWAKLKSMDPQAWEQKSSVIGSQFLEEYGVFSAMAQMGDAIKNNKLEDITRLYNDLVGKVFRPMREMAQKQANDPLKADRDKIASERQEVLNEKQKVFYGGVRTQVNSQMTGLINRELRTQLGDRRLNTRQGNKIRGEINAEIARLTNSKPEYQRRYAAMMKGADHDKAVEFIVRNATTNISRAIKNVLGDNNLLRSAGSAMRRSMAPAGRQDSTRTSTTVGKPKAAEVDWTRSDKAQFILPHGQVWRKDGKLAKW